MNTHTQPLVKFIPLVLNQAKLYAIDELLNTFVMARYVVNRINVHHTLYQSQISSNPWGVRTQTYFEWLYFVVLRHLQAGNTIFWLDNDNTIDIGNILTAWQYQLLQIGLDLMISVIDEIQLSSDELLSLVSGDSTKNQLSDRISQLVLYIFSDEYAQKDKINDLINTWQQAAKTAGMSDYQAIQASDMIRSMLRMMYLIKSMDLSQFYEQLSGQSFCQISNFAVFDELDNTHNATPMVLSHFGGLSNNSQWDSQNAYQGFGIWLYRLWFAECGLAMGIKKLLPSHIDTSAPIEFGKAINKQQRQAITTALGSSFSIITGGPGTGKTFTVAHLVMILLTQNPQLRLALVAPTGKAAQRMQESLAAALSMAMGDDIYVPTALTIHRLLGLNQDGIARYHAQNPLPYDVVVVDEASMLGVELAYKLVSATSREAKLILLGDSYQLSAVDAGAVLADLCRLPMLQAYHTQLIDSKRFDSHSGVGALARLINHADVLTPLTFDEIATQMEQYADISLLDIDKLGVADSHLRLIEGYRAFFEQSRAFIKSTYKTNQAADEQTTNEQQDKQVALLFESLANYRILTASHQGDFGDETLNQKIATAHYQQTTKTPLAKTPTWYHGKVVMITQNSYELGLFNGDTGICVRTKAGLVVYFDGKDEPIATSLLPEMIVTTAYAITIHKSQGSEFTQVAICFDESNDRLLGRELIYTAVTRAKRSVVLYSTPRAIIKAIHTPTQRQTGLGLVF